MSAPAEAAIPLLFHRRAALVALPFLLIAPLLGAPGWLLWVVAALGVIRATRFALDQPRPWARRIHRYLIAVALGGAAAALWSSTQVDPDAAVRVLYVSGLLLLVLFVILDRVSRPTPQRRDDATLSVCIICKDEADRIAACLEAVHGWADQIVVMDSGSTDDTVEIARRYADVVEVTDWPGFGAQRLRAQARATGRWVFHLDCDERLTEDARHEIDEQLSASADREAAIAIRRATAFDGAYTAFGYDATPPVRLFLRAGPDGYDDAAVHERVHTAARARLLRSWLLHDSWRDREHMRAKLDRYAELQSSRRRGGAPALRGVFSFLRNYLLRVGFADGRRGLVMALEYARYTAMKYRV